MHTHTARTCTSTLRYIIALIPPSFHLSSSRTLAGFPSRTTSTPLFNNPSTMLSVAALVPAQARMGPISAGLMAVAPRRYCGGKRGVVGVMVWEWWRWRG